jgi:hypothetical protein
MPMTSPNISALKAPTRFRADGTPILGERQHSAITTALGRTPTVSVFASQKSALFRRKSKTQHTKGQTIMVRIFFSSLDLAIAHAKQHGGWIAECDDETFQWFALGAFTMTPIMLLLSKEHRGNANIGPWSMFDPTHESHSIVVRENR